MNNEERERLLQGRAYTLFFHEYGERLKHVGELLSEELSESDRLELGRTFHTLKGGAGFFGFDEIARVASMIEQICASPLLSTEFRESLLEGCQKLDNLSVNLPAPVASRKREEA
jgi:chemotaxis protein histidine kinase CheA